MEGVRLPAYFEEQFDAVMDEAGLGSLGSRLIDDLHEARLPLFVQWFNTWKQQREQNQSLTSYNTVAAQKEFTE